MNIDAWIRDQLGGSSHQPEPEPEEQPEPMPLAMVGPKEIGVPTRRIVPGEDPVRRLARRSRTIR